MKTVSNHKISLAEVLPFVKTSMDTLRERLRADEDLRVLADLPDGSFLTLMDCVASAHMGREEGGIEVLDDIDIKHGWVNPRWLLEQCIDAGLVTSADVDKILDGAEA